MTVERCHTQTDLIQDLLVFLQCKRNIIPSLLLHVGWRKNSLFFILLFFFPALTCWPEKEFPLPHPPPPPFCTLPGTPVDAAGKIELALYTHPSPKI